MHSFPVTGFPVVESPSPSFTECTAIQHEVTDFRPIPYLCGSSLLYSITAEWAKETTSLLTFFAALSLAVSIGLAGVREARADPMLAQAYSRHQQRK